MDLSDLSERVPCRACGSEVFVPVVGPTGVPEAEMHYRLDGLAARVMDQDVLPVLLALPAFRVQGLFFCWPGVHFKRDDKVMDVGPSILFR